MIWKHQRACDLYQTLRCLSQRVGPSRDRTFASQYLYSTLSTENHSEPILGGL